jgi:hypothetical protein
MLWSRNDSHAIAEMFVAIFERELGDAGFVEVAKAFIAVHSALVALREGILYVRVLQPALHYELETNLQVRNPAKKLKQRFGGKPILTFSSAWADSIVRMAKQLQTEQSFLRITIGGDNDPAAGDLNLQRKEGATGAGPTSAFTCIRFVKRSVSPASQKLVIITEKLVWPPVERRTSVDTIVDIGVIPSIKIDDERFDKSSSPHDVKLYRFARCNFGN